MATQVPATKSKFGVPIDGSAPLGILQPKLKFRFRITFDNNFGGGTGFILSHAKCSECYKT